MANSLNMIVLFSLLLISFTFAQTSFQPKALLFPAIKNAETLQYITYFRQGTLLTSNDLTIDLGGKFLWADCEKSSTYRSSTYRPARCGSRECKLAHSVSCNNNTCGVFTENTITHTSGVDNLGSDLIEALSTYPKNPGPHVLLSKFLFVCGSTSLLKGLAYNSKGMVGLGRTTISFPSQFASGFNFPRKFSLCLNKVDETGLLFFGNTPYIFLPNINISSFLTYTPLITNPMAPSEYFIGVKSIKIKKNVIPIIGLTKISTIHPYTVLERSIYNDVVATFVKEMGKISKVRAVAPFEVCFNSKDIVKTRVGFEVPDIHLVLHTERVYWSISGANSMVEVSKNVLCLGFVDGGDKAMHSIVIGGYQMENNMLEFDIGASKLGFSSSLLLRRTTCSSFNFTVIE